MSSSLLETDSSYGTSQVSLSKTDHSKLREELGEINFVLDWRGFKLLCAEYLHLRNDKCQIDLLLVAASLHSVGLRISLQFSSWRRGILGKSWHVSPGMLSPHLLCGSAVFFRRNFYLTFTFFFFAFFFPVCLFFCCCCSFCLLGANRIINQPHQRNRICLTESGHKFPWTAMTFYISSSCDNVNWYGFLIIFILVFLTWLLIISSVHDWAEMNWCWILGWLASVFAIGLLQLSHQVTYFS